MPKRSTARRHGTAAAPPRLPTREEILAFVENAGEKVGKREIARAFHIRGDQRRALKALLAEMADESLLVGNRKSMRKSGELPPVALLDAVAVGDDGTLLAEPVVWDSDEGPRPRVAIRVPAAMPAQGRRRPDRAPAVGDRILTRITRHDGDDASASPPYRGEIVKVLPREGRRLLGIFRAHARGGGTISPVDRKSPRDWNVPPGDDGDANEGDLVRFEIVRRGRNGLPQARVLEALGNPNEQRQVSLIAIHAHGLSDEFPDAALAELERLPALSANGRTDLRDMPLITIDPADARDHDDAVHAEADPDPANNGGWIVTVAIADVAHYVRSGTGLDREAQNRGNSVYFPDRVVPMLPEAISNDLCSLREGEDRPCLAVRMVFDTSGTKRSHTFLRAIMRSARKLSYEQAQAVFDAAPPDDHEDDLEHDLSLEAEHGAALDALWRAYRTLATARNRRQPLELELPERKLVLNRNGDVERVVTPERLDAHKLIEEFMIQANVAAAETLERQRSPLIYRSHDQPSRDKLKALREFFETLDLRLPNQSNIRPVAFNGILDATRKLPVHDLVNEVILRAQAQAEYTSENYGHFGLNL
ncbi:MAG: ribonuclease R family protein, partial [Hyphomicrobiaceae bacterium]